MLSYSAFAQQYSLTNLNDHALRFSCWHFNSVKDEEEFLMVPFQVGIFLMVPFKVGIFFSEEFLMVPFQVGNFLMVPFQVMNF